jgi:hypothetical protein
MPSPSAELAEALDNTSLEWITGGDAEWFSQTTISYYGNDAAQSGDIFHNRETWLQTTVDGPGILSFWWKISSQPNHDFLQFTYNDDTGLHTSSISGTKDWNNVIVQITGTGTHSIDWKYIKDVTRSLGEDAAWVDKVEWYPGATPTPASPTPTLTPTPVPTPTPTPTPSPTLTPTPTPTATPTPTPIPTPTPTPCDCTANFSADPTVIDGYDELPDCVQFADLSTGAVTSWAWDLNGDNEVDSYARIPYYCYARNGYYTITLTVTCQSGCQSMLTKDNYIYVYGCGG